MNEWHQSFASMARNDVAMLRPRDRYHRVLITTIAFEGVNSSVLSATNDSETDGGVPFAIAERVCDIASSVWAVTSAGSGCSFFELSIRNLGD
jgi:hypothetical protein